MKKQTAGRDNLGDLAPKFAELNDDVLFGEVWSREDKLSLRDRSIITVTALITNWAVFYSPPLPKGNEKSGKCHFFHSYIIRSPTTPDLNPHGDGQS